MHVRSGDMHFYIMLYTYSVLVYISHMYVCSHALLTFTISVIP